MDVFVSAKTPGPATEECQNTETSKSRAGSRGEIDTVTSGAPERSHQSTETSASGTDRPGEIDTDAYETPELEDQRDTGSPGDERLISPRTPRADSQTSHEKYTSVSRQTVNGN